MERWKVDSLITDIHDLLYQLGVRSTIQGFFETSCAVFLVMCQPDRSWFSITELYQRISELYHVELEDVDPHIRRVIQRIWRLHPEALNYLAGRELRRRPTPRQFIKIMCHYLITKKHY